MVATGPCLAGAMYCERRTDPSRTGVSVTPNDEKQGVSSVTTVPGPTKMDISHPLEQRRQELVELIAEVNRNRLISKKGVLLRLGKPKSIQEERSKRYANRIILTTLWYDTAPGEYLLPNSHRETLDSGSEVYKYQLRRAGHAQSPTAGLFPRLTTAARRSLASRSWIATRLSTGAAASPFRQISGPPTEERACAG